VENLVKSGLAGKRAFLTGHTGFKGGWLALCLARLGVSVRGYALDPATAPSLFEAARIGSLIDDVRGDIRDEATLGKAMREWAPDVVFHLAAQPMVLRSYADPVGTYAVNVLGTVHLLESIRRLPSVGAVVVVTTDKCYQNQEWPWGYRESDPLGGHDPYSSSKACAEIVSASYRSSYSVTLATARAGNVIGGGDWSAERLIPDLVRGFLSGKAASIRCPSAVRPWQHVLEPIAGYLLLAEKLLGGDPCFADAWNFGPLDEDAWPVERVATAMARRWGGGATWSRDGQAGLHEASRLKLDSSKARAELGWRPRLRTQNAVDWMVEWYLAWRSGEDMQAFTLRQIADYARLGEDIP
jgi:CDP-glucose 4,6-dehydratase